jgi:hypothetical protein
MKQELDFQKRIETTARKANMIKARNAGWKQFSKECAHYRVRRAVKLLLTILTTYLPVVLAARILPIIYGVSAGHTIARGIRAALDLWLTRILAAGTGWFHTNVMTSSKGQKSEKNKKS